MNVGVLTILYYYDKNDLFWSQTIESIAKKDFIYFFNLKLDVEVLQRNR